MKTLPRLLTGRSALFLDFDGTLAELAPRPEAVVVPRELIGLLGQLFEQLDGAMALVTGRAQADIEPFLAPLRLPAAFEHGAVRRPTSGTLVQAPTPELGPALAAARALAARHPGLLVEHKQTAMALHFRLAPEMQAECTAAMAAAIAHDPGLQLLRGKAVVEVKSAHVSKGLAIAAFMKEAPFAGREPVFAGDDVTDEAGFDVVQQLGGTGVKVGEGPTCAAVRVADPLALRAWLQQAARLPPLNTAPP
ncbi:MAG: trehalose-phosphatase [Hydrogenophaga sp.]|nr:trehalose-phosphatase [Hydrogenophaga sp.]